MFSTREKIEKLRSSHIEIAVARHFGYRQNVIVPNVFWGLGFRHELDLLLVTQRRVCWEIEIKVSVSDLKRDVEKRHQHQDPRLARLYFAISETLVPHISCIPESAGVLVVDSRLRLRVLRPPRIRKAKKLTDSEYLKLLELGTMRIWTLKQTLMRQSLKSNGFKLR